MEKQRELFHLRISVSDVSAEGEYGYSLSEKNKLSEGSLHSSAAPPIRKPVRMGKESLSSPPQTNEGDFSFYKNPTVEF